MENKRDQYKTNEEYLLLTSRQRWERGFAAMGPDVAWAKTAVALNLSDGSRESMSILNTQIGTVYSFVYNDKTWQRKPLEELNLFQISEDSEITPERLEDIAELMFRHNMILSNGESSTSSFVRRLQQLDELPADPNNVLRQAHRVATDKQNNYHIPDWGK